MRMHWATPTGKTLCIPAALSSFYNETATGVLNTQPRHRVETATQGARNPTHEEVLV